MGAEGGTGKGKGGAVKPGRRAGGSKGHYANHGPADGR